REIVLLDDVYALAFLTIHNRPKPLTKRGYPNTNRSELALLVYSPDKHRHLSTIRRVTIQVDSTIESLVNVARRLGTQLATAQKIPTFRVFNHEVRVWNHIWESGGRLYNGG
ncbi:MAG: hypothetical protein MPJ50_08360, partial [Pirellulales bacterium]|nr:hypothetical protein [Pirellulales bacterium]